VPAFEETQQANAASVALPRCAKSDTHSRPLSLSRCVPLGPGSGGWASSALPYSAATRERPSAWALRSASASTGSGTVIVLPVATNARPSTSAFNRSGPPSLRSTTLAFVRVEVRGLIIVPSIRLTEAVYAPLTGRSCYVGECCRLASCLRCG